MNTTTASLVNASDTQPILDTSSFYNFADVFSVPLFQKFLLYRTIALSIVILLGVFGNVMTIVIVRRLKSSRSATDRYFLSLAVADLCVIITQSIPVWLRYTAGFRLLGSHDAVCKIAVFVYNAAVPCSSWILVTMATHRALMVTWPHRVNAICTPTRSWSVVLTIAAISCLSVSHMLYGVQVTFPGRVCSATGGYKLFLREVWLPLEPFLQSFLPISCILPSNIVLVVKLRVSVREASDQLATGDTQLTDRRKTVSSITLQAVVVSTVFVVVTLPVAVWNGSSYVWSDEVVTDLHSLSVRLVTQQSLYLLSFFNYCANFYLYCLTGSRFRNELKYMLCSCQQNKHDA